MRELERRVLLSVLDRKWREHLYEMDYLREGIGLRAYSQRDPLVEYQREGFDMFSAMMDGIKEESVGFLFNLEVQVERGAEEDEERARRGRAGALAGRGRGPRPPGDQRQGPRRPEAAGGAVLLRARRRPATPRSPAAPSPTPTTRTPGSAATPSARAAPARSTRSATAHRAAPPGSPPASTAESSRAPRMVEGEAPRTEHGAVSRAAARCRSRRRDAARAGPPPRGTAARSGRAR